MTQEELETVQAMKSRGFAVIIWTPEELGDADADLVEDRSIELGWQIIEDLKGA